MRQKIIIGLIVATISSLSFAIKLSASQVNTKYGKVSIEELKSIECPIDSNAHAYFIFDNGSGTFNYRDGFQITYERHFRIKILSKQGFDFASTVVSLFNNGSDKETMGIIKACTYNLEGGKIVKSELKRTDVYRDSPSKFIDQVKFAMPNVKEGSVIEVRYTVLSTALWNFNDWDFQHYIPVLNSSYYVAIPEYFTFNQTHRGYLQVKTKKTIRGVSEQMPNGSKLEYNNHVFDYSCENAPAFPLGEQLTTPDNYLAKVVFELASFTVPGAVYKDFSSSWKDVDKLLLDDDDFGLRLKSANHLKDAVPSLTSEEASPQEKMAAAFEHIKYKMKWNDHNSCWTSGSLKKTYEAGLGNAADINLNLVALLRHAQLDAFPVTLSTRSNGMIFPVHPSINQMNYVIAACLIDGKWYLMDATEKYSEIDVLPVRCLNGQGRVIDRGAEMWVDLLKEKSYRTAKVYSLNFDTENGFTGEIKGYDREYRAMEKRILINQFESPAKYIDDLMEKIEGMLVENHEISNADTSGADLNYTYQVKIPGNYETAGEILYFKPMLFDAYSKNPFSLEKREYPIEYPYPINESVVITIKLPEGFNVESLPKSISLSAINENCRFTFHAGYNNNMLSIRSTLIIKQTIIPYDQYAEIKTFFEQVVEKHQERVVLKKI